jgi:ubiquinone/menaquinone biosynthesis C-methylase UbiE
LKADRNRFVEVRISRDGIRRRYARLSHSYDFWGVLTESKASERALQLAGVRDGESVLEVAVGTGALFEKVLRLNPSGNNDGIDLSPEMLDRARKRLAGRFSNYTLSVGDACSLAHRDASVDLLVCNYMFDLLPEDDFPKILREFARVLNPQGRMVITTMTSGQRWDSRFWNWLVKVAPQALQGCRPVSLEEYLRAAGFRNIKAEYVYQFTFPSLVLYADR